ncbi:hypothetical protein ACWCXH_16290 [Kitasatospora sp. NPDC001660]
MASSIPTATSTGSSASATCDQRPAAWFEPFDSAFAELVEDPLRAALAWRPGSSAVLASAGAEGTAAFWRADSGRPGTRVKPTWMRELPEPVTALAWADPRTLVIADYEGRVEAWPLPDSMAR